MLWVYSQAPQNVVMREDSGVTSMAELDGARLNPGITGSATEATTIAVMETLGLTPEYVRGSTTDVVAGVKDNRMAGYVKSGVGEKLDGSSMDIATFTPIQVLSAKCVSPTKRTTHAHWRTATASPMDGRGSAIII